MYNLQQCKVILVVKLARTSLPIRYKEMAPYQTQQMPPISSSVSTSTSCKVDNGKFGNMNNKCKDGIVSASKLVSIPSFSNSTGAVNTVQVCSTAQNVGTVNVGAASKQPATLSVTTTAMTAPIASLLSQISIPSLLQSLASQVNRAPVNMLLLLNLISLLFL